MKKRTNFSDEVPSLEEAYKRAATRSLLDTSKLIEYDNNAYWNKRNFQGLSSKGLTAKNWWKLLAAANSHRKGRFWLDKGDLHMRGLERALYFGVETSKVSLSRGYLNALYTLAVGGVKDVNKEYDIAGSYEEAAKDDKCDFGLMPWARLGKSDVSEADILNKECLDEFRDWENELGVNLRGNKRAKMETCWQDRLLTRNSNEEFLEVQRGGLSRLSNIHVMDGKEALEKILSIYRMAIENAHGDRDKTIVAITNLVRSIFYLHPRSDANTRFCMVLYQRELVRFDMDPTYLNNPKNIGNYPSVSKTGKGIFGKIKMGQEFFRKDMLSEKIAKNPVHSVGKFRKKSVDDILDEDQEEIGNRGTNKALLQIERGRGRDMSESGDVEEVKKTEERLVF